VNTNRRLKNSYRRRFLPNENLLRNPNPRRRVRHIHLVIVMPRTSVALLLPAQLVPRVIMRRSYEPHAHVEHADYRRNPTPSHFRSHSYAAIGRVSRLFSL
jgi:hypothetical protein